ncbi:MAG: carboxypeptidase regulatory-like domain-containing protein [Lysobacterales bacterium]
MIKRSGLHVAICALLAVSAANPLFAQTTSAAVAGVVSDSAGQGVANATIEIVHNPSGTRKTVTADAEGRYSTRGLRVGGPYTITAKSAAGEIVRNDVFLQLDETTSIDLAATAARSDDAVELETFTVTSNALDTVFAPDNIGTKTIVTQEQIEVLPTIQRSIEDFVRVDPRVVQIDKERGGIAVAGQNNRYNNIRIDGVPTNDQFGLNDSGLPSLNQPISIDWIQEFNIGVADYDVTQKDFVGGNINAVTKSGGNEFHGSVYGLYRDKSFVGDDENGREFTNFEDEYTAGGYVSGPIIQDKLYFFLGYEKFERAQPGTDQGVIGSGATNTVGVTQAQLDQILAIARGYGIEPGNIAADNITNTDDKYFAKLDWNISDAHRASFRYNKTDGTTQRLQAPSTTSLQLSSNAFTDNISFENYALSLYSNWNDNLSTEANVSYAEYRSTPQTPGNSPQIRVNVDNANSVVFGSERSRHANLLAVDTYTALFAADYFAGDHTVRFGGDYENNEIFNLFLQDVFGNYEFGSQTGFTNGITNFQNGRFNRYRLQVPTNGDVSSVGAGFEYGNIGFFVQDTWAVNDNLNFVYGARFDTSTVDNLPASNPNVLRDFGINNQNVPDDQSIIQPRVGFNYTFDTERRMQLRGGLGLFQGSSPGVWLSNSFSNPGVGVRAFDIRNSTGFSANPDAPFVPAGGLPSQLANFLSEDFEQPTVWKANLGFEMELPWWGLIGSAEYLKSEVRNAVRFTNLAIGGATGVLPDGRLTFFSNPTSTGFNSTGGFASGNRVRANCIRVNPALGFNSTTNPCLYTNAILLSNTGKGSTDNFTLSIEKPWANNWSARLSYTLGEADEVSPGTSSVALSNFQNRAIFNPNEEISHTSNYEIKERFVGTFAKRFNFFSEAPTTLSFFYEGRDGRPYSYGFFGDANGDGISGNDLFAIPDLNNIAFTSGSAANDIAAFRDFILSNDYLSANQGSTASRNALTAPWVHQVDMKLSQEIPFFFDTKAEIFLDVENLGNLINDEWGHIDQAEFPYNIGVANFAGVNAAGQVVYDVSNYVNAAGVTNLPRLARQDREGQSRWALQVGVRLEF